MKKILLDTNFLIEILRHKIELEEIFDLVNEKLKFMVPGFVISELRKLSTSEPYAKLALEMIKKKKVEVIKTDEMGDRGFFRIVDKNSIVATNDSKLRKELKALGIKSIYLRKRKRLEMG